MQPLILEFGCRNFRSYRALSLKFSSRFVVFCGRNGAGKTNILEGVSLFSSGRGLRKAAVSDLNNFNSPIDSWNLNLTVSANNYETFLNTYAANGRRTARIDGNAATSLSSFEDFIWLLWITPEMVNMFIGAVNERRKFFDHLVSGFDKKYKGHLKKIANLQKERMSVMSFRRDENWLLILEKTIAEESVLIAKTRHDFLKTLHKTFRDHNSDFLRPIIDVSGTIENIVANNSEEDAVVEISELLKNTRAEDTEKQTTFCSVQKSLWTAYHPKTHFKAENCSTGEQKAFLISCILAAVRIYGQLKRGVPVLLLDDLMVHLDEKRRASLCSELIEVDAQTFFTGTESYLFESVAHVAQRYYIENSICTESSE